MKYWLGIVNSDDSIHFNPAATLRTRRAAVRGGSTAATALLHRQARTELGRCQLKPSVRPPERRMIPPFNLSGVLPPYVGASPAVPAGLSPYDTSMRELAEALATSRERATILRGLLALRGQLHALGITNGYQWCAGSFCEDIERLESRSPGDIDVVTFFTRPAHAQDNAAWSTFVAANSATFDPSRTKAAYRCDAYFVDANSDLAKVINQVTYWHGLFGHQRSSHMWKGMLRLPLLSDDGAALNHLDRTWP